MNTNMLDVVKQIDSKISSYTEEENFAVHDKKVINTATTDTGYIVSNGVTDPSALEGGNGFIVKWKRTGETKWYPQKVLDGVNSEVKLIDNNMLDIMRTAGDPRFPLSPQLQIIAK